MGSFICALIIGGVSGWLAGKIMKSEGSLIRNIVLGLLGGLVGGWLGNLIGVGASNWIGSILIAVAGSCLLIWLSKKIFK